jgi:hypothetical protein
MKANVTGYQPYLQQRENIADADRHVTVTSHAITTMLLQAHTISHTIGVS